jgi:peptidoglycan hydrolase CwlO-like protein
MNHFTATIEKTQSPEDEELERKKESLAELEAQLADRELELASSLGDLVQFEKRYLQTVGRRYAMLDELKAKIAELRAQQNPHKDARDEAQQARAKAQESAQAGGESGRGANAPDDMASLPKPNRSESLRSLYRQAARLLHPDLCLDGVEKEKRLRLMAEVNEAYARGDEERIRGILREWQASPESVQGDGPGAELVRVIRKIAQVERRLKTISAELDQLRQREIFELRQQVQEASSEGRDLLKELVDRLERDIAEARDELKRATHKSTL